jgi:hypothetical protein
MVKEVEKFLNTESANKLDLKNKTDLIMAALKKFFEDIGFE